MPRIPYEPRNIQECISVLGTKTARITQTSHLWDRVNKRVTITYDITVGELVHTYNEQDEIISTEFIPDDGESIIKSPKPVEFKADNDTFVNPLTGDIIKYADQGITPEIEAMDYMGQYDWFQMMADTQQMVITDFIIALTEAKINNKEFTLQRYETIIN